KTGLRVNLPLPDCSAQPSTCTELTLLNQLDGFSPNPRVSVRFSGPINADTLRAGMFLVALDNLTNEEYGLQAYGGVVLINQVVYDPATNTAYAKTDTLIDQHRRYVLVVTDAVEDASGAPVAADPVFTACGMPNEPNSYFQALANAISIAAPIARPHHIIDASVFTTMSATAWLEKARAAIQNSDPAVLRPSPVAVFRASDIASVNWHQQVGASPATFNDVSLPYNFLPGVGAIAFGSFQSPDFLNDQQYIPAAPTAADVALPPVSARIYFHVFLPSTPKPSGGFPVVIAGHGLGDDRFIGPTALASTFTTAGFAVIAIDAAGAGYGPQSSVTIQLNDGSVAQIPANGRGVDLNGDGVIDEGEGCILVNPTPVGARDCQRQTALDLSQLTRAIEAGIDLDGDGAIDLSQTQIDYLGQSFGAIYGTVYEAIEPTVLLAALNSGGGSIVDIARWSVGFHSTALQFLTSRTPPLANTQLRGQPDFNEDFVLRYQPADVVTVPGAIEIQNLFARLDWIEASGDALYYAPHLLQSTLPGVPIKNVLWSFGKGDETVPNPAETALVRAAGMESTTWFYRHDLARAADPLLPENPHAYLLNLFSPPAAAIANAMQNQIAQFFASGGTVILDPNAAVAGLFGVNLFEIPTFLPETLSYASGASK
ncbi:MAG: hypothetical protein ABI165_17515, partial [Bryobacteraceae bacterium]